MLRIPDHPNKTNQKILRVGDNIATLIAKRHAEMAMISVMFRDNGVSCSSVRLGFLIFWYISRVTALDATTNKESIVDMIAERTMAM